MWFCLKKIGNPPESTGSIIIITPNSSNPELYLAHIGGMHHFRHTQIYCLLYIPSWSHSISILPPLLLVQSSIKSLLYDTMSDCSCLILFNYILQMGSHHYASIFVGSISSIPHDIPITTSISP